MSGLFGNTRRRAALTLFAVLAVALPLRLAGLYRGLADDHVFHPDEPKQVRALESFLYDRYVRYDDSRLIDGYPFGLNHVDEWIMRPLLAARAAVVSFVAPGAAVAAVPVSEDLYRWARALRVAYGLLSLLVAYLAAGRLLPGVGSPPLTVLLIALAPVSVAVAHTATGDIGTDLFCGLALLLLAHHARAPRALLLFSAALAAGLAFACKYNGILVLLAFGLWFGLLRLTDGGRPRLFSSLAATLAGVVAGAVIATPAFLFAPERTWRDIWTNFLFIKDYHVAETLMQRTALERALLSLRDNLPFIVRHLGVAVVLLACAGAVFALRDLWRARREPGGSGESRRIAALRCAVFLYPFAALALALTGKPVVQPFHFSFLQLPLVLAAVFAISRLRGAGGRGLRLIGAAAMLLAVVELGRAAEREVFFWSRQDNGAYAARLAGALFTDGGGQDARGTIRDVFLESERGQAAAFRNKSRTVAIGGAVFWNDIHVAPVPAVPYPADLDWLFLNGPAFPRDDRTFRVAADTAVSKQAVLQRRPGTLRIGVRCGSLPAEFSISLGGRERRLALEPNSQTVFALEPRGWRASTDPEDAAERAWIVPLRARARTGPVWVSVLADPREENFYRLFGGAPGEADPAVRDQIRAVPAERLVEELGRARFLDSGEGGRLSLDAAVQAKSVQLLPEQAAALPAGAYVLECEIVAPAGGASVDIRLRNTLGAAGFDYQARRFGLTGGLQTLRFPFSKTFAPLETQLAVTSLQGRFRVESWRLVPDAAAIVSGLRRWADGGAAPPWLARYPAVGPTAAAARGTGRVFGDALALEYFAFPGVASPGERVSLYCGMSLVRFPLAGPGDYGVFVHLCDRDGEAVFVTGTPVTSALASSTPRFAVEEVALPDDLPPGEYQVRLGVWNTRTRLRLQPSDRAATRDERRRKYIVAGSITIRPREGRPAAP